MSPFPSFFLFIIFFIAFVSCGSHSLEDFREEGEAVSQKLLVELSQIHTRQELLSSQIKLKRLFNDLVIIMIAAQNFREKHPDADLPELSLENHLLSDKLRTELDRIFQIEGARELLEKFQEESLDRLDAFEQQRAKKH